MCDGAEALPLQQEVRQVRGLRHVKLRLRGRRLRQVTTFLPKKALLPSRSSSKMHSGIGFRDAKSANASLHCHKPWLCYWLMHSIHFDVTLKSNYSEIR